MAHVDVGTDDGQALARRFAVTAIPAFVLLDERGAVLYRQVGGRPDGDAIARRLAPPRGDATAR